MLEMTANCVPTLKPYHKVISDRKKSINCCAQAIKRHLQHWRQHQQPSIKALVSASDTGALSRSRVCYSSSSSSSSRASSQWQLPSSAELLQRQWQWQQQLRPALPSHHTAQQRPSLPPAKIADYSHSSGQALSAAAAVETTALASEGTRGGNRRNKLCLNFRGSFAAAAAAAIARSLSL